MSSANLRVRLGERIKELRNERGWRQIDLAVTADLSKAHIYELEKGQREVCLDALCRIAKALDQKPSTLLHSVGI